MPGEQTEHKRLDFNVPILSARRHAPPSPTDRPSSAPVRSPGVVPFLWEHAPGRPKAFSPCNPIVAAAVRPSERSNGRQEVVDEECSTKGLAGSTDATQPATESFFITDPAVRDFLLGRFLSDALAVAAASPQEPTREPPSGARHRSKRPANPWPPDIRKVGVLQRGVSAPFVDNPGSMPCSMYSNVPPPLLESPADSWLSRAYVRKSSDELKWRVNAKRSEVRRRRPLGEVRC